MSTIRGVTYVPATSDPATQGTGAPPPSASQANQLTVDTDKGMFSIDLNDPVQVSQFVSTLTGLGLDRDQIGSFVQQAQVALPAQYMPMLDSISADLLAAVKQAPASGPNISPALSSRWGQFAAEMTLKGSVDINSLVQVVLRNSYLETTKDLYFYAEKVKFFNGVKDQIRDELKRAREFLAKFAGYDSDDFIGAYQQVTIDDTFYGSTSTNAATDEIHVPQPQAYEINGVEVKVPPEIYMLPNFDAALAALNKPAPANLKSVENCSGMKANTTTENLFYFLAVGSIMQKAWDDYKAGNGDRYISADAIAKQLNENFGIPLESIEISSNKLTITLPNGDTISDQFGDGGLNVKDNEFTKTAKLMADDLGIASMPTSPDEIKALYATVLTQLAAAGIQRDGGVDGVKGGAGGVVTGSDTMVELLMLANLISGTGTTGSGYTKAEHETYIQNLEEQLSSVGDDAQLANVDLQNMLQKQQQNMQMMSNIAKMLHDTAMAIVRKIGG